MKRLAKELVAIADSFSDYAEYSKQLDTIGMYYQKKQEMLENYVAQIRNMDTKIYTATDIAMKKLKSLKDYAKKEYAKFIIQSLKEAQVDPGDLSSRFVDEVEEASGEKIYPASWKVNKSKNSVLYP